MTAIVLARPGPENKPYQPFGRMRDLLLSRAPEVMLAGPAGTGKSRACLEKVHLCAERYPGMRALIVRKTRVSLTHTGLVTLEEHVVPEAHPILQGPQRSHRNAYHYPNGSEVVIGGMDNPVKVMSGEYDLIYCLAGDTLVDSPSRIEKGFSRPYSGPIVTIRTAAGHELTGTPNHPILTDSGWVALGDLHPGSYVVSRLGAEQRSGPLGVRPDVQDGPAPIADVVRALAEAPGGSGRTERVETVPMDFHGDGGNSYVDVVTPAFLFDDARQASFGQQLLKLKGQWRDFQDALAMRLGSLERLAGWGHAARVRGANLATQGSHALPVAFGVDPLFAGDRASLPESLVPLGASVADVAHGLGFATSAGRDSTLSHLPLESGYTNPDGLGDGHKATLPSEVALDRVVEFVRREAPRGWHVYNLQTVDSWYYANNIVSHNCQEATELTEADWEQLTTRLRNGRMPYQQIIGDCNPGPPTHWIKQRADRGDMLMLDTRHQDNPTLYDHRLGEWTEKGREYLAKLDKLTGVRRRRLRDGEWAAAEGAVYEEFDRSVHLIDRDQVPELRRRWRVHDFGFTNPYVCQWWGEDHDGRLYLYREIYYTRRLVEDHAKTILRCSEGERIEADVCDHDAEDRATLERHLGVRTVAAHKAITPGIEAVTARLRPAGDGRPRIYFVRDALVERDDRLAEAGLPWCTEQEFDSYAYPAGQDGKPLKEVPVDKDNHGMDAMRYAVAHVDDIGGRQFEPADPIGWE